MANEQTIVDVTKGLIPLNQEAIAESITYSDRGRSQPIPYAAKNVLPTSLGYQSFFGTQIKLGSQLLQSLHVQDIISYRLLTGNTILLALCAEGCYFSTLSNIGDPTITDLGGSPATLQVALANNQDAKWTFLFNSPQGSTSPWFLWTWAVLGNDLYLYQKGMKFIAKIEGTRYGQFTVKKLLPSYIINGANKVYKYLAHLELWDPSALTERHINFKSSSVSVKTITSLQNLLAHNYLTSGLLSAGIGAQLLNYQKQYAPAFTYLAFPKSSLATPTPVQYNFFSAYWGYVTNLNSSIVIRGVAISLTKPAGSPTRAQVVQSFYDQIRQGIITNNIQDVALLSASLQHDGSSTSLTDFSMSFSFWVKVTGGNDTVTKGSGDSAYTVSASSGNPSEKPANTKFINRFRVDLPTSTSIVAGTTYAFTFDIYSASYTARVGDTKKELYDNLGMQLRKQGIAAYTFMHDKTTPNYILLAELPSTYNISFTGAPLAINFSSQKLYFMWGVSAGGNRYEQDVPFADLLTIVHNGSGSDVSVVRKYIASTIQDSFKQIIYRVSIPSTGGTFTWKLYGITLANIGISGWSIAAQSFDRLTTLKNALEPLGLVGIYLRQSPSYSNPAQSLEIEVRIPILNIHRPHGYEDSSNYSPQALSVTAGGVEYAYYYNAYSAPNDGYGATFSAGWDIFIADSWVTANGNKVSWNVNGNYNELNMAMNYAGGGAQAYIDAITNALLATPGVTYVGNTSYGYQNFRGTYMYGATIRVGISGWGTGKVMDNFNITGGSVLAYNYLADPNYITNHIIDHGPWLPYETLKVDRTKALTSITITYLDVPYVIPVAADDDNETIAANITNTIPTIWFAPVLDQLPATKYSGDIQFSIASFDGTDPLVSVGPTSASEPFTIVSSTNEVIELAQVEGICVARNRLMAWDYTNTIYLGAATDPIDFTPSITTQANSFKVEAVKGSITLMLPTKDGVIIYSTDNISKGTYQPNSQQLYSFRAITDQGTIDPRHITLGRDAQFFLNSDGVYRLDPQSSESVAITKELAEFLRSYKYPTKVQMLGDRYLIINLLDHPVTIDGQSIREGSVSTYEKGLDAQGLARPTNLVASIPDVPIGQNLFPTFKHCLVLDLLLEKWGYGTIDNLAIFSLSPINQGGYSPEKDYALSEAQYFNDSRSLGAVLPDGQVTLLNDNPSDSYILYGKYRLSNSRLTRILEVEAQFVDYPEATLQIEPSDEGGRIINFDQVKTSPTFTSPSYRWPLIAVARWFNILVRGRFNLSFLSIDGVPDGKRK